MPVFQAPAKQDLNLRFEWNAKMVFFPPDQFQGLSFSSENFNRFDKKNSSHDLFKFQRAKLFDPDQQTRTNSETFCFLQPFTRLLVLLCINSNRVDLNQKLKGLHFSSENNIQKYYQMAIMFRMQFIFGHLLNPKMYSFFLILCGHPKEIDVHFLRTFFNNCLRKCKSMQNLDLDRV